MADKELLEELSDALKALPGLKIGKSKGGLSFTAGKKVVAFTIRDGVAMKLPADRIERLRAEGRAEHLVMGKRAMQEWAYLVRSNAADFRKEIGLFKEALGFVASLEAEAVKPPPKKPPARKTAKGKKRGA